LPADAPEGVRKAANGQHKDVTVQEEQEALKWLLGSAGKPMEYTSVLQWETDEGMKPIRWRIQSLPAATIERVENENRQDPGDPFSRTQEPRTSAALVVEATIFPDVRSVQFRTPLEPTERNPGREPDADPVDALLRMFRYQSGLLMGLAGEVRRISGYDPQRVGIAKRSVTRAVSNSSS
jgi:hypothetical protein